MGDPFQGAVSWDKRGDDWIGVFHPGYVDLLRTHVDGLRKLAVRRLAEHSEGADLGPIDKRLDAVLWGRRMGENVLAASELEMLIPAANRWATLLAKLPENGGVVELDGWHDRFLWGTVALDLCVAIQAWLFSWSLGELVDGMPCPDEPTRDMWQAQYDWLRQEIVVPLQPA
ncbi:hypothetical protein AB5J62_02195 [Amycolatopsis sp. cg5]|uniref:hypothetical protein n=1 Tax=Amycolatopsis sp. cg5 TaxID=3238802 RepID=UPI003523A6F0